MEPVGLHLFLRALPALLLLPGCRASESLVTVRLVSERSAIVAGGSTDLGVHLRMAKGWHTYWRGSSDSGAPLDIRIEAPEGFAVGESEWPAPERMVSTGDVLDHVYEGSVTVIAPVSVPLRAAESDSATFRCVVQWVACREACLAGADTVSLTLPVAPPGSGAPPASDARLFREARRRIPGPGGKTSGIRTRWEGDDLVVEGEGKARLVFYPDSDCGALIDPIRDAESDSGRLRLRLRRTEDGIGPAKGILEINSPRGSSAVFVELNETHPGPRNRG